jgi:hypothetical protein
MKEVWRNVRKLDFFYFFLNNYLYKLYYKIDYIQSYVRNFSIFDSHVCTDSVV